MTYNLLSHRNARDNVVQGPNRRHVRAYLVAAYALVQAKPTGER